jgi:hypothetical protein
MEIFNNYTTGFKMVVINHSENNLNPTFSPHNKIHLLNIMQLNFPNLNLTHKIILRTVVFTYFTYFQTNIYG